jgi:UDP-glucuronate decarboxylase
MRNNPYLSRILLEDYNSVYDNLADNLKVLRKQVILVTGASGMIGSYIVLFLIYLNEYYSYGLSLILTTTNPDRLRAKIGIYYDSDYVDVIKSDLTDLYLNKNNINYIIHAASLASPHYYRTYPVNTLLPNIIGTYNLLKIIGNKEDFKRFLFISSLSVLGNLNTNQVVNENTESNMKFLDSNHIYGASKLSGELLLSSFIKQYGIRGNIVRLAHSFGPGLDYESDTRIFSEFVKAAVKEKPIIIHSMESSRYYTYLSDVLEGILLIITTSNSEFINNLVSKSNLVSNRQIADFLSRRYNISYSINPETEIDYVRSSRVVFPKVESINAFNIGWRPRIGWRECFERTIYYYNEKTNK